MEGKIHTIGFLLRLKLYGVTFIIIHGEAHHASFLVAWKKESRDLRKGKRAFRTLEADYPAEVRMMHCSGMPFIIKRTLYADQLLSMH
jgi:hypothetical protein